MRTGRHRTCYSFQQRHTREVVRAVGCDADRAWQLLSSRPVIDVEAHAATDPRRRGDQS